MTDAPEQILAWEYNGYRNVWGLAEPNDCTLVDIMGKYIREDLSTYDAGFAAGIKLAVDRLKKLSGKLDILACEDVLQIADELSALAKHKETQ
jgi:hypothetical protein